MPTKMVKPQPDTTFAVGEPVRTKSTVKPAVYAERVGIVERINLTEVGVIFKNKNVAVWFALHELPSPCGPV